MPHETPPNPVLADLVGTHWTLGAPTPLDELIVFPLFGADPAAPSFVAFGDAVQEGVVIRELPTGASVNDLLVDNPGPVPVLLYDGEEVLGAKQNRVFDGSVMVPTKSSVQVAVCCVEQHRWDGSRANEHFTSSGRVTSPGFRSRKSSSQVRTPRGARANQQTVWGTVKDYLRESGSASSTDAFADAFEDKKAEVDQHVASVPVLEGQCGMLAVKANGQLAALDYVARPAVYARMHDRLTRGYALDAVLARATGLPAAAPIDGAALLKDILATPVLLEASPGSGRRVRTSIGALRIEGLESDGRLVQVSAFAAGGLVGNG